MNDDGSLGERNDVQCLSIEHKLGIKGSVTAVLQYGGGFGRSSNVCAFVHTGTPTTLETIAPPPSPQFGPLFARNRSR